MQNEKLTELGEIRLELNNKMAKRATQWLAAVAPRFNVETCICEDCKTERLVDFMEDTQEEYNEILELVTRYEEKFERLKVLKKREEAPEVEGVVEAINQLFEAIVGKSQEEVEELSDWYDSLIFDDIVNFFDNATVEEAMEMKEMIESKKNSGESKVNLSA